MHQVWDRVSFKWNTFGGQRRAIWNGGRSHTLSICWQRSARWRDSVFVRQHGGYRVYSGHRNHDFWPSHRVSKLFVPSLLTLLLLYSVMVRGRSNTPSWWEGGRTGCSSNTCPKYDGSSKNPGSKPGVERDLRTLKTPTKVGRKDRNGMDRCHGHPVFFSIFCFLISTKIGLPE
jgi:hypothetical protein